MPGWLSSADSGLLTWTLSNATWTAWNGIPTHKKTSKKTTRPKPRT